jgi:hypothetical protein
MTTTAGTKKLEIYINHLENARKLLLSLPNRYYRSLEANKTIHEQAEKLAELQKEIENLRNAQQLR